jgi:hypothetical protein
MPSQEHHTHSPSSPKGGRWENASSSSLLLLLGGDIIAYLVATFRWAAVSQSPARCDLRFEMRFLLLCFDYIYLIRCDSCCFVLTIYTLLHAPLCPWGVRPRSVPSSTWTCESSNPLAPAGMRCGSLPPLPHPGGNTSSRAITTVFTLSPSAADPSRS